MNPKTKYINKILINKGFNTSTISSDLLDEFTENPEINNAIDIILNSQDFIMKKWEIRTRIIDFTNETIIVPNGTINKEYSFTFDKALLKSKKITQIEIEGLDETGLEFDIENLEIFGTPKSSGDYQLKILFKVEQEDAESEPNEKIISLIINPDPKSLWKNIDSDTEAIYWKKDNESCSLNANEKSIVISSKRGRSHQNVGSFRDDHYAVKFFKKTNWTIIAISDGAGSAPLSRKGSQIACDKVINYFENELPYREFIEFEEKIIEFENSKNEELLEEIKLISKKGLYKATIHVHNEIKKIAEKTLESNPEIFEDKKIKSPIEAFHSTLIFCAFKKFDFGYLFLTFSVGDCPIGILSKDKKSSQLLNWLDVGEFGGGTRFITQPEIFHSKERPMITRFNFHIQSDFSYLFMMTDGIYDPKFVVEANLEKQEKWLDFINDLEGDNEDNIEIKFDDDISKAENDLNKWIDFWSKGNHDDRTLAIVY